MASPVLLSDYSSGAGAIRLGFVTSEPIPAWEAARLIEALDTAFRAASREYTGRPGFHLTLAEAHQGSLWLLLLAAADAAELAQENPDVVAVFMHDLSTITSKIAHLEVENVPKHFRDLIGSISQRMRRNTMRAIHLAAGEELIYTPEFVHLHRRWQELVREAREKEQRADAIEREPPLALPIPSSRAEEIDRLAASEKLFGTLFLVEGEWYARLEGLQGVLVPLTLSDDASAIAAHAMPYRLEGHVLTSPAGYPIGFAAIGLFPLAKGK